MFHSHSSAQGKIQEMGEDRVGVGYEDEADFDRRSVAEASRYSEGAKTRFEEDSGTGEELGQ
jgi:hypothetical protein